MSTTPTLRDAAQAVLDLPRGTSGRIILERHDEEMLRAALTQGAGEAVEPFGYWHQGATEEESDFFKHGDMGNVGCEKCITLYAAPPAQQLQQAVARALAPIQQAIRDYHYALDTRQHGGIAITNAFETICSNLGMHWKQGEEAAIRAKGTHD